MTHDCKCKGVGICQGLVLYLFHSFIYSCTVSFHLQSKYIANLKRTAEVRKIEQELAYERKVQKERETEGEAFSDKDSFVTPSYLRKLEERAAIEERLRKEEEIESES